MQKEGEFPQVCFVADRRAADFALVRASKHGTYVEAPKGAHRQAAGVPSPTIVHARNRAFAEREFSLSLYSLVEGQLGTLQFSRTAKDYELRVRMTSWSDEPPNLLRDSFRDALRFVVNSAPEKKVSGIVEPQTSRTPGDTEERGNDAPHKAEQPQSSADSSVPHANNVSPASAPRERLIRPTMVPLAETQAPNTTEADPCIARFTLIFLDQRLPDGWMIHMSQEQEKWWEKKRVKDKRFAGLCYAAPDYWQWAEYVIVWSREQETFTRTVPVFRQAVTQHYGTFGGSTADWATGTGSSFRGNYSGQSRTTWTDSETKTETVETAYMMLFRVEPRPVDFLRCRAPHLDAAIQQAKEQLKNDPNATPEAVQAGANRILAGLCPAPVLVERPIYFSERGFDPWRGWLGTPGERRVFEDALLFIAKERGLIKSKR